MIEVVYIVRHAFRSTWETDSDGNYRSLVPTPTGIPTDAPLTSHGVDQSRQLADHLVALDPPIDLIYSSPFCRCIQTLEPALGRLLPRTLDSAGSESGVDQETAADSKKGVRLDGALAEYFAPAKYIHPPPAKTETLVGMFPDLITADYVPTGVQVDLYGENKRQLHDRMALTLDRLIRAADRDVDRKTGKPAKALLICFHASPIIAACRVLTGTMPVDSSEPDFTAYTAGMFKFVRRNQSERSDSTVGLAADYGREKATHVDWRNGRGVAGGWDCVVNADFSFLKDGPERGWSMGPEEPPIASAEIVRETVPSKPGPVDISRM